MYHDDGIYIVTAQSLSQGTGYRIVSLPGSPPQTKYPILYSYILSWVWSVSPAFPGNIAILKSVNVVCLFFIVLIAYKFYHMTVPGAGTDGYLYAALVGANPGIFSFADFAVSDLLFVLLVLLAWWLYGNEDSDWFHGWRVVTLALISVAAVLTRSAGVPLAMAGLVHFLWMRRFRELAIYSVTLALAMLPWLAWRIGHEVQVSQSSLLAYYLQYNVHNTAFYLMWSHPLKGGEMLWANLRYLFDSLDVIWLLPVFPQLRLRLLVLTLLAVGVYSSVWKHSVFLIAFVFLYLLLILGWPFSPTRYVLPLVPLLLLFVFKGIHGLEDTARRIWRGIKKWPLGLLVRGPVCLLACLNLAWLVSTVQPCHDRWVRGAYGQRLDYSWSGFLETFAWIRSNTHVGDVLATAYDPMYYLYTGRRAIIPAFHKPETYFYPYRAATPDVESVEEIKREFRRLNVRYLVTNPLDEYREGKAIETAIAALLGSYSRPPHLAFTSLDGRHKVYQIPPAE
ncbi:MAG: hypothetical protein ACM37Z_20840 [Deltaproteobacteria bacterium]